MRPPIFAPSIIRLSGRPRPEPDERAPTVPTVPPIAPSIVPIGPGVPMTLPLGGKGRPHADRTVEAVRELIEETTLTYHQIAAQTGTSIASISRWMQAGGWKRPLFAPRSMLSVPTPRATAYNKHRTLGRRLARARRSLRPRAGRNAGRRSRQAGAGAGACEDGKARRDAPHVAPGGGRDVGRADAPD